MFQTPLTGAILVKDLSIPLEGSCSFSILGFEFVSDFVLRISNLLCGRMHVTLKSPRYCMRTMPPKPMNAMAMMPVMIMMIETPWNALGIML